MSHVGVFEMVYSAEYDSEVLVLRKTFWGSPPGGIVDAKEWVAENGRGSRFAILELRYGGDPL